MGKLLLACAMCLGASDETIAESPLVRHEFTRTEMAVPIRIVLYAADPATARKAADAAFDRFHELNAILSDYDPESELRRLCATSGTGRAVVVSADLWRVLEESQKIAERSEGAFDVTIGPIVRLWRSARRTKEPPAAESLAAARQRVGYQLMRLDSSRRAVELLRPEMRLDLGGIAKGYAVDEAMAAIRKHGITRMMIEAGGNVGLGDPPPEKPGWRIGIMTPESGEPPREYLWLSRAAVSTSGDARQYAVIRGTRYSHLIDPRTGEPLTDHCQATVVGPDGMGADGLSSALAVLGPEKGLPLIDETPGAAALIVRTVDGKEEVRQSKRWQELQRAE